MATIAETLRLSARVIEGQPHLRMSAVTAIRIAAGAGRVAHEHAEETLRAFAAHLGIDVADLESWSTSLHKDLITAALREAAEHGTEATR